MNDKASPWLVVQEKSHRMMAMLSLRLRLFPQGRSQHAKVPDKEMSYYDRLRMECYDEQDR